MSSGRSLNLREKSNGLNGFAYQVGEEEKSNFMLEVEDKKDVATKYFYQRTQSHLICQNT